MKSTVVKRIYDWAVRPILPRKIAVFNGIPVRQPKLFDFTDVRPNYEEALVDQIRTYLSDSQDIVIVGGGAGVSSVIATQQSRKDGTVTTYEGAKDQVNRIHETSRLNKVESEITVHHAIVGPAIRVYGETENVEQVSPDELPACDTLILDCEGAEINILEEMSIRPETIIVETHPMFDAPKETVCSLLTGINYEVVSSVSEQTEIGEITVLTAQRKVQ